MPERSPSDFYREMHPNFFSDSVVEEVSELDRSMLEYHIASITTRSQEADFERFARKLCEREVCPNLLPSTGPTGGGDSKADTETYPVAETLKLTWYSGFPQEAGEERWAFAFSAKAAWQPKVTSDVKKIVETSRNYVKAFFVSNQMIPARLRSGTEDSLSKKYGIDVRIFDCNWIVERVFAGHHENLAIEELKLTSLRKQVRTQGPSDVRRTGQLQDIEARISAATSAKNFSTAIVDDAIEAAELCRSLERPRTEIEGAFGRADRLALRYGTHRQQVEAAYQWAWTLFWWFDDIPGLVTQYAVVESRAKDSNNVYDIERLNNLWNLLNTRLEMHPEEAPSPSWLEDCTNVLRNSLTRLAADSDRPSSSLQARSMLLMMSIRRSLAAGDNPSTELADLANVITEAEGLIGYPLDALVQMVEIIGVAFEEDSAYNSLFDKAVESSARRKGEVKAAEMLLRRGNQLFDQGKPIRSIAIVGQALGRLYKHETRKDIVSALFLCAKAYERIGLLWAARGTFLSAASISANEFWRYGDITRGFVACVNALKWVELRLGRIPQVLVWHQLDTVLRQNLFDKGETFPILDESDTSFDGLLSRIIIRTRFEELAKLEFLPDVLEQLGLYGTSASLLFLLGYPDDRSQVAGERHTLEEIANNIWNISADVPLPEVPCLYEENAVRLTTSIFGCSVAVNCPVENPCVEIAESILASLESFLATSAWNQAIAFEPNFLIDVVLDESASKAIEYKLEENLGRVRMAILCRPFDAYDIPSADQMNLRREIFEAALMVMAHSVRLRSPVDLESLFRDERVIERASAFTGSVGTIQNVLGNKPRVRISDWRYPEARAYGLTRRVPWVPETTATKDQVAEKGLTPGDGDPPPGLIDVDSIRHDQMRFVSPLRARLWDRAGWVGALYITTSLSEPPILGLMFEDREAGRQIIQGWIEDFGETDETRTLRITIIRGIDKANPYAYRMVIGANIASGIGNNQVTSMLCRVHRMDATTPDNLNRFVEAYSHSKRFVLLTAYFDGNEPELEFDYAIGIYEINIRDAWTIGRNDIDSVGVLVDDDIIIPDGIIDPPVLKLQEWKRTRIDEGLT